MKKQITPLIIFSLIAILLISSASAAPATSRLSGDDRYSTAVAISKAGWAGGSDAVILANAMDWPDALVGAALAHLYDAPVLLTSTKELSLPTEAEIRRLQPTDIYILGPEISTDVETKLDRDYNVTRIAGPDRMGTAIAVAEHIRQTIPFDTVFIATENVFADSLAAAPFSAQKSWPILLSGRDALRADTKACLQAWGISNAIIVGGEAVISNSVKAELESLGISVGRIWGDNRYLTALEIVRYFEDNYQSFLVATGDNYPDALAGAALAAKWDTPILTVGRKQVPQAVLDYILNRDEITILGGAGAVSDNVRAMLSGETIEADPQDTLELLHEKLSFDYDLVTFTVYAFMNYTGYDFDNYQDQDGNYIYHPVREGIRRDLAAMNLQLRDNNYFTNLVMNQPGLGEGDFAALVGSLGTPPNFKLDYPERNMFQVLRDLDVHLSEFYVKATIPALYKKYKPYYDEAIAQHQQECYPPLVKTVEHFNLDQAKLGNGLKVVINLADMYWRGYMITARGTIDPILMIGPDPKGPNVPNIAHEFSHVFVSPVVAEFRETRELSSVLYQAIGAPSAGNGHYNTWEQVIDESFVRAITVWSGADIKERIQTEMADGFVMTEFIYNRLDSFPDYGLSFEDFVRALMLEYAEHLGAEVNKPVTGLTLDSDHMTLRVGEERQLSAQIQPADAKETRVNWISTDTSVATVTNGKVSAVGKGNAVIIAASVDGGFIAYCKVVV